MALNHTVTSLKDLLAKITQDLSKAESGNKAASQRVRTNSVRLEKIAKMYRKESISNEKGSKGSRKPAKKSAAKTKKPASKMAKAPAAKIKSKPKAKAATARPRAFALKRPTAKLPMRSFR